MTAPRGLSASVRSAREGDVADIVALAAVALPDSWSERSFRDALHRPATRAWVIDPLPSAHPRSSLRTRGSPWTSHADRESAQHAGCEPAGDATEASQIALPAFLIAHCVAGELTILMLAVHPRLRRRGLGRAVLRRALQEAWRQELDRVHLEVRESNRAAQALYHDVGFVVAGVRPRYYRGGEDALLMTLELAVERGISHR